MGLELHNSLTGRKEPFTPHNPGRVGIYICGPTVYHDVHIGNLRTFLLGDLIHRYFIWADYDVTYVSNITDVGHLTQDDIDEGDDKLEAAARRENTTIWDIAKRYTEAYHEDCKNLSMLPFDVEPLATDHIDEMIAMISTLLEKKHAYVVDGEVYFDISTFADYGKLSKNKLDDLKAGARVDVRDGKRHPGDFALWKTDDKHLMQWDTPWGRGFPGWHIECSAMSSKYLGETFDIHIGGEDLAFPHHECEIAQSEAANEKSFVRWWVHGSHLQIEGNKMSKSQGTMWKTDDLVERGYSFREIRYLLTSAHYRQNLNFTLDGLESARASLRRFDDLIDRCERAQANANSDDLKEILETTRSKFTATLNDDLNISGAWGALFEMVTAINKLTLSDQDGQQVIDFLKEADRVVAVLFFDDGRKIELDCDDDALIAERLQARESKNWARADEIRDIFAKRGLVLEDTADGTIVKPK